MTISQWFKQLREEIKPEFYDRNQDEVWVQRFDRQTKRWEVMRIK